MILVILCLFSLSPTSSRNLKLTIVKKRIMAGELPLQVYSKSFLSAGIFFLGVIQIFPRIWNTKGVHSVTALLFVVLIMPITPRYSLWNLRYYLWMEIFELRVTDFFPSIISNVTNNKSKVFWQWKTTIAVRFNLLPLLSIRASFCLCLLFKPSFNLQSSYFNVSLNLVAVITVWILINFVTPLL